MTLTEDDLQQVLRRRALQRERLLPREGQQAMCSTTEWIVGVLAATIVGLVVLVLWHGGI